MGRPLACSPFGSRRDLPAAHLVNDEHVDAEGGIALQAVDERLLHELANVSERGAKRLNDGYGQKSVSLIAGSHLNERLLIDEQRDHVACRRAVGRRFHLWITVVSLR